MKPLDIDGNELKVGDDVEVVMVDGSRDPNTIDFTPGDRFVVVGFVGPYMFKAGMDMGALYSQTQGYKCNDLRLIPRDTKAPTKIEFVTTKEGVR